ncbi:MAG: ADP-glyceromanno-heptose 6-epimerase [Bacteroidota bacterium]
MIIITGAAGFIGSCIAAYLNEQKFYDLVLVDDFSPTNKLYNYSGKRYASLVDRDHLFEWLKGKGKLIQFVLHMGARTDTTEQDKSIFDHLNLNYSKKIWHYCTEHAIPLIYASSAATYGGGELGFDDKMEAPERLKPLNPYGESKHQFDQWVLDQQKAPYFWAGLKFFNVFGPNEYHKGRMASVVFHTFNQIRDTGGMKLFRSHRPDFQDGHQQRDFVYVKDLVEVIFFLMNHRKDSGIYNLGTGQARTFLDLARNVFSSLSLPEKISFIDTPADIREAYQYYTQADMAKLLNIGYSSGFRSLESSVEDYVKNHLSPGKYW